MPTEVEPSALSHSEMLKMPKKDIVKYLSNLQDAFEERGKKYEKAKTVIRQERASTRAKNTSTRTNTIPKPPGRRSRSFSIIEGMNANPEEVEVSREAYNDLIQSVHTAVNCSSFDRTLPLSKQDPAEVLKVIAYVKDEYPYISKFQSAWPVKLLATQFMNNTRKNYKIKASNAARPSAVAAPADLDIGGNEGGDQSGEDSSDVQISDVEDN